ncbi:MAG: kelch repeat-containing protein [Bacteroidota bacterium]
MTIQLKRTFKRISLWLGLVLFMVYFTGCDEDDSVDPLGNWLELSDFEGIPRSDAASFQIGDKGYVVGGYDGFDRLKDVWEYDYIRDFWVQKADFPAIERNSAVGFSIGNQGYIGTGYDGKNELGDFWVFNPDSNAWTAKADFGGSPRYGAVGFSLDGKGYIATGYDGNNLKDMWEYDPTADSWTQQVSVGGSKRVDGFVFVLNGKAYVGGGRNNGVYEDDFWEYDPATKEWTRKADLVNDEDDGIDDYNIVRSNAISFATSSKGYLGLGFNGGNRVDVWEYEPVQDFWVEKTDFEGVPRNGAVSFSFDNKGFFLTGTSGGTSAFDDVWLFEPDIENDEDD